MWLKRMEPQISIPFLDSSQFLSLRSRLGSRIRCAETDYRPFKPSVDALGARMANQISMAGDSAWPKQKTRGIRLHQGKNL